MKKWDGVRGGSGNGGSGFETGDARGDIFNEIVTLTKAFWCGKFGCDGGSGESVGFRGRLRSVGGGGR